MKLGNNFTCVLSNSNNFDKTRVKLFPNFTRHRLNTHSYNVMGDYFGVNEISITAKYSLYIT